MNIINYFDKVAIYFLYTVSLIGGGIGGIPVLGVGPAENLEKWELWLARTLLVIVSSLGCLTMWLLIKN